MRTGSTLDHTCVQPKKGALFNQKCEGIVKQTGERDGRDERDARERPDAGSI